MEVFHLAIMYAFNYPPVVNALLRNDIYVWFYVNILSY